MKTNYQLSRPQITDTKNQLWHQIPEKKQEIVSGGIREGGRTVGGGIITKVIEEYPYHLAIAVIF